MSSEPVPDKSPLIITVGTILTILPIIAVSLRFISRRLSTAGIWWDDWVVLLALPFSLGLNIEVLYGIRHGFGKHAIDGPADGTSIFFKLLYGGELLYNSCVSLCKISVLLFYYRIFGFKGPFRVALIAVAILVFCWFISMSFAAIFQCNPIPHNWDESVPGHCFNLHAYFIGQAVPNVATDFILLLLPLPMLWKLHMAKAQKIALIGVFIVGYFVPVVSVLRLVCAIQLGAKTHEDVTWNVVTLYLWSCTEPAVGIVSTCIPSISYLFKRAIKSFSPSAEDSHGLAAVSNQSDDRYSAYNKPPMGKPRHHLNKFATRSSSDFIKLKDVTTSSTLGGATLHRSNDDTFMNPSAGQGHNYDVAVHADGNHNKSMEMERKSADDLGRGGEKNGHSNGNGNGNNTIPLKEIHVRRDLDVSYE